MKRASALLFGIAAMAALLGAADISGKWKGQFQGGDSTRELTFNFKVDGEKLTGTVAGLRDQEVEIKDGKIQGDTVSFYVMSEWQGQPVKLVYKGQVSGDEIRFNMANEEGSWGTEITAKRIS